MQKWLNFVFLTLGLISLNFLNTAPTFNLPVLPELIILAVGLCILYPSTPSKSKGSGLSVMAWAGAIILIVSTTIRAILSHVRIQMHDPLCSLQPAFTQQLECLFQAGIEQNSSLRMALYLITATCLFAAAFRSCKKSVDNSIPLSLLAAGGLFVGVTMVLHWFHIDVPGYIIGQVYSDTRLSILIENPTWIWPLLTPTAVSLIYFLSIASDVYRKIVLSIFGVCLAVFLIRTQQRGAILAAAWILLWIIAPMCMYIARKFRATSLISGILASGLLVGLCFPDRVTKTFGHMLSAMSLSDRILNEGFASSRTDMWRLAFQMLDGHWLFGFGHGSWYREFSRKALPAGYEAYDTAHNFFVQTLFELGSLHLLLVLVIGSTLSGIALRRSWNRDRAVFFTLAFGLGLWILVLSVQEVDFVRSVYYCNALCAGWIFSRSSAVDPIASADAEVRLSRIRLVWAVRITAVGISLVGIFLSSKFTLGGYQYEAHYSSQYQQKVRWLRPKGTLGFFSGRDSTVQLYALYQVLDSRNSQIEVKQPGEAWQTLTIGLEANTEVYIPVKDQRWFEMPTLFRMPFFFVDYSRYLSVLVQWPPRLSTLPIVRAEGLLDWETSPFDGNQVRWCGIHCRVQFMGCGRSQERILTLMATRPDISDTHPLFIRVAFENGTQVVSFTEPHQMKQVTLPADGGVSLTADRTYSTDLDSRSKGILLSRSECNPSKELFLSQKSSL